jgi:hypothetical protein
MVGYILLVLEIVWEILYTYMCRMDTLCHTFQIPLFLVQDIKKNVLMLKPARWSALTNMVSLTLFFNYWILLVQHGLGVYIHSHVNRSTTPEASVVLWLWEWCCDINEIKIVAWQCNPTSSCFPFKTNGTCWDSSPWVPCITEKILRCNWNTY